MKAAIGQRLAFQDWPLYVLRTSWTDRVKRTRWDFLWGPKTTLGGTFGASHGLVSEGEVKAAMESPNPAISRLLRLSRLILGPYALCTRTTPQKGTAVTHTYLSLQDLLSAFLLGIIFFAPEAMPAGLEVQRLARKVQPGWCVRPQAKLDKSRPKYGAL